MSAKLIAVAVIICAALIVGIQIGSTLRAAIEAERIRRAALRSRDYKLPPDDEC